MTTTTARTGVLTIVDATTASSLPWLPLDGFDHVTYRLLWQSGKSVAGIMYVPHGAEVPVHRHSHSEHHMWVMEGTAHVDGRAVGAATYLHVPAGVRHGVDHVGRDGCTVMYLYLRDEGATSTERGPAPSESAGAAPVPGLAPAEARPGDRIVVHGPRIGAPDRDGEILEVRGDHGAPPYVVRWSDNGHETLFFPGSDATIHHLGHAS